ncbi:MAG: HPr(Ser) kinase/phosphatase [Elusimicrobiota bacterium]|nr:HPr(Ser) kinase/phosphatase [Elusimicrobiota bacterium]
MVSEYNQGKKVELEKIIGKLSARSPIYPVSGKKFIDEVSVSNDSANILGLELTGFLDRYVEGRIHILSVRGFNYLNSLKKSLKQKNISELFSYDISALIITDGIEAGDNIKKLSEANGVPVFETEEEYPVFIKNINGVLEKLFAPVKDYQGTMMEVFGVGVMLTGKSNVGKSECAIDLLQRGHRMIGDDVVSVTRRGDGVVLVRGKYPIASRMELRGVGIIDIVRLMGISSVEEIKKVELIINLERWIEGKEYERLGIEEKTKKILDVPISYVEVPISPGRNSAIMVEVATMNYRLRRQGIITGSELERQVLEELKNEGI